MFGRKEATPEPEINGVAALRRRLLAWSAKPATLQAIARDTPGVSVGQLEEFANGRREFSGAILQAIVKVAYSGYATYDIESGMLKSTNTQPPIKGGAPPEPCVPDDYVVARAGNGPVLVDPPKTKTVAREGFADPGYAIVTLDYPPPNPRREKFIRARPQDAG